MAETAGVPARVRTLAAQVGDPTPMRRGSLTERYVKCSKPGCRCAEEIEARHGPYYSLTRTVGGRTQSRLLPAAQAPRVREQIAAGQEFRRHVDAYWEACEHWADAELAARPAPVPEGAEKGLRTTRRGGSRRGDRHPRRDRRRRGLGLRGDRGGRAPRRRCAWRPAPSSTGSTPTPRTTSGRRCRAPAGSPRATPAAGPRPSPASWGR